MVRQRRFKSEPGLRLRKVHPRLAIAPGMMLPSRHQNEITTTEKPVSQLNTQLMVSPVNASRQPSRAAAHRGRSGWLGPTPQWTFTSYPLPACPGALTSWLGAVYFIAVIERPLFDQIADVPASGLEWPVWVDSGRWMCGISTPAKVWFWLFADEFGPSSERLVYPRQRTSAGANAISYRQPTRLRPRLIRSLRCGGSGLATAASGYIGIRIAWLSD